jgi:hypothetical protein
MVLGKHNVQQDQLLAKSLSLLVDVETTVRIIFQQRLGFLGTKKAAPNQNRFLR